MFMGNVVMRFFMRNGAYDTRLMIGPLGQLQPGMITHKGIAAVSTNDKRR